MVETASTGPPFAGTVTVVFVTRVSLPCHKLIKKLINGHNNHIQPNYVRAQLYVLRAGYRLATKHLLLDAIFQFFIFGASVVMCNTPHISVMKKQKNAPSLKFCLLTETVWRQEEDHRYDFLRSAEIKTADMTSVPPVNIKPVFQTHMFKGAHVLNIPSFLFFWVALSSHWRSPNPVTDQAHQNQIAKLKQIIFFLLYSIWCLLDDTEMGKCLQESHPFCRSWYLTRWRLTHLSSLVYQEEHKIYESSQPAEFPTYRVCLHLPFQL